VASDHAMSFSELSVMSNIYIYIYKCIYIGRVRKKKLLGVEEGPHGWDEEIMCAVISNHASGLSGHLLMRPHIGSLGLYSYIYNPYLQSNTIRKSGTSNFSALVAEAFAQTNAVSLTLYAFKLSLLDLFTCTVI